MYYVLMAQVALVRCLRKPDRISERPDPTAAPDPRQLRELGVDRYRRSALVPGEAGRLLAEGRGGEAAFDALEQYHWPDPESARAVLADPGWAKAGAAGFDERPGELANLVVGRVRPWFGNPFPDNDRLQIFTFVRFRAGLDPAVARRYWSERHGPIANRVISESFGALSYAQIHADPELEAALASVRPAARRLDGFVVTHWEGGPEDVLAAVSTEAAGRGNEELLADEPHFLGLPEDQGSTAMMATVARWHND
jgi:hypothetical protein